MFWKEVLEKLLVKKEYFNFNFLRPLMTAGLPLMKRVFMPLSKSILLSFGLSAAMSATDATIQKNFIDLGLQHW